MGGAMERCACSREMGGAMEARAAEKWRRCACGREMERCACGREMGGAIEVRMRPGDGRRDGDGRVRPGHGEVRITLSIMMVVSQPFAPANFGGQIPAAAGDLYFSGKVYAARLFWSGAFAAPFDPRPLPRTHAGSGLRATYTKMTET